MCGGGRRGDGLFLLELLELGAVAAAVGACVSAQQGGVELGGGGLRPFRVGGVLVAGSGQDLSALEGGYEPYLLNTSSLSSSRLPCPW